MTVLEPLCHFLVLLLKLFDLCFQLCTLVHRLVQLLRRLVREPLSGIAFLEVVHGRFGLIVKLLLQLVDLLLEAQSFGLFHLAQLRQVVELRCHVVPGPHQLVVCRFQPSDLAILLK